MILGKMGYDDFKYHQVDLVDLLTLGIVVGYYFYVNTNYNYWLLWPLEVSLWLMIILFSIVIAYKTNILTMADAYTFSLIIMWLFKSPISNIYISIILFLIFWVINSLIFWIYFKKTVFPCIWIIFWSFLISSTEWIV